MSHFGDPQFLYHRAMAQYWGLIGLRMASARVLPLQAAAIAQALPSYSAIVQESAWAARLPELDWTPLTNAIDDFFAPAAFLECYRVYVSYLSARAFFALC
jgi:N-acetylated-alpha-linked acidic dipeptidase